MPADVRDRIVELSKTGMSVTEVAAEVGVGRTTVGEIRRAAGVRRRFATDADIAEVRALYRGGMSVAQVAAALGWGRWTVHKWVAGETRAPSANDELDHHEYLFFRETCGMSAESALVRMGVSGTRMTNVFRRLGKPVPDDLAALWHASLSTLQRRVDVMGEAR